MSQMSDQSTAGICKTIMPTSTICNEACDADKLLPVVFSYGYFSDGFEHKKRLRGVDQCWPVSHGLLMDENLWSKLPVELLERIIGNLPIDAMFRARSVCKAWRAYISSYGYAHLCYTTPSEGPWCLSVVPTRGEIVAYDVTSDKWHQLPLPGTAVKCNMKPFSTGANLVCFKSFDNSSFFTYNALTKTCTDLTPNRNRHGYSKDKVWMVTDESQEFNIVVFGESGMWEIFDSYSNRWSEHACVREVTPYNICRSTALPSSVSSNGILYLITGPPYDLVTFDTITKTTSSLYLSWPENTWNRILSEHNGRIYLLAFQKTNALLRFCEWELNFSTMMWMHVQTMPSLFNLEDTDNEGRKWQLHTFTNRNPVILQFSLDDEIDSYFVLYNRALRHWRRISNLPTFSDKN